MNTSKSLDSAARELCEELFKLSGWDGKFSHRYIIGGDGKGESLSAPAYDLSYLVRKVPKLTLTCTNTEDLSNRTWVAWSRSTVEFEAETPEDAVAKVAIELFKKGVLV